MGLVGEVLSAHTELDQCLSTSLGIFTRATNIIAFMEAMKIYD